MISKIGLGTAQFGMHYGISNKTGKTPDSEVKSILDFAKKSSLKYLDTAFAYGNSESVLGLNNLSGFNIVSKFIQDSKYTILEQHEISLHRLNVDKIYAYLAHRPLELLANKKENWKILQELKATGQVEKIGASFNSKNEIEELLSNGLELDIIQVPYNFLDSRFEKHMQFLKNNGCEVHTRSTFLQGLFFCDIETLPSFFDELKPLLKQLQTKEKLSALLSNYVLEKNFVDIVIMGINSLSQLKNNLNDLKSLNTQLKRENFAFNEDLLTPSKWPTI